MRLPGAYLRSRISSEQGGCDLPTSLRAQRSNPSFCARGDNGLLRFARNDVDTVSHSRGALSSVARMSGATSGLLSPIPHIAEPVIGRAFRATRWLMRVTCWPVG